VTDITDRGRRGGSRSPESVPVVRSAGLRIAGEVVHRAVLARGATHATRGRLGPHRAHVPGAATLAARWGASGDAVLVDADSARRCAVNASRATTARLVCSARQALIALAASPVFAVERRAERRRLVDPATRGRLDAGLARRTRCARVPLHPAGVIRIAERTDVSLAAAVGTILGVAGLDSTAGAAPAGLREANRRRALALLTELASETAAAVLREAVRAVHGVFAAALAVRRTAAGQRLDAGAALLALESRGTAPARDAAPPAGRPRPACSAGRRPTPGSTRPQLGGAASTAIGPSDSSGASCVDESPNEATSVDTSTGGSAVVPASPPGGPSRSSSDRPHARARLASASASQDRPITLHRGGDTLMGQHRSPGVLSRIRPAALVMTGPMLPFNG